MQRILSRLLMLVVFSFLAILPAQAKNGYKIQLKLSNPKDSMLYLVHYYGKPMPTIYKTDSSKISKAGVATMQSKDTLIGGIYMILMADKQTYFEFLLNNGDDITITADVPKLPDGVSVKGSTESQRFYEYLDYMKGFANKHKEYDAELAKAKTKGDTTAIQEKYAGISKELLQYRKDLAVKYAHSQLANIFNAMEVPVVPSGKQLLADGTVDSTFSYRYYKEHYWDKFDFTDDRLINTPIYDSKLEEYINKLTIPYEDSVIKEANMLLAKAKPSKELFKYTLWWLTRNAESSKIMGMDAVFVYLVENYYMKGDAFWLSNEDLQKYIDRAHKIAPNVIGNLAPEITMPDINGKMQSLRALNAKYTMLIFWSPDCGHCLTEMPKVDSMYRAVLKAKGVKIFAVRTDAEEKWKEVIEKDKLQDWIHVHDPEHKSNFRADYDIYSTPVIYLLDDKKIIRGKRLDHINTASLVEMLEKKEKDEKEKKSK
jgi:peroxiredoxin